MGGGSTHNGPQSLTHLLTSLLTETHTNENRSYLYSRQHLVLSQKDNCGLHLFTFIPWHLFLFCSFPWLHITRVGYTNKEVVHLTFTEEIRHLGHSTHNNKIKRSTLLKSISLICESNSRLFSRSPTRLRFVPNQSKVVDGHYKDELRFVNSVIFSSTSSILKFVSNVNTHQ